MVVKGAMIVVTRAVRERYLPIVQLEE